MVARQDQDAVDLSLHYKGCQQTGLQALIRKKCSIEGSGIGFGAVDLKGCFLLDGGLEDRSIIRVRTAFNQITGAVTVKVGNRQTFGLALVNEHYGAKLSRYHTVNFVEQGVDELVFAKAGVIQFKHFFNKLRMRQFLFVFLQKPKIFVGKGGVAQERCQHLNITVGVDPICISGRNRQDPDDFFPGFNRHADKGLGAVMRTVGPTETLVFFDVFHHQR